MPWRLIQFIVIFVIFLIFAMFNLENKCNINFGFANLNEVPVFLTAFTAFILGILCALPFAIQFRIKKKNSPAEDGTDKKSAKIREKKNNKTPETQGDSSFSDGGPYGIN